jgi:heterodisulfide reductase subunit A
MSDRRIGVYICHCGGNISDYVDVEAVREAVSREEGVVVAKTAMFTCSDATQQEMLEDIGEKALDGLVVASCSPKLHLHTFREVAKRAGLNPYRYTQVNVREQCSWAHTDDKEGATEKAVRLVRAGIARTLLTESLEPVRIDTVSRALVVGAGIAGLRAALGLSDIGIAVYLVERENFVGGRVAGLKAMYPHGRDGGQLIGQLVSQLAERDNVVIYTGAGVVEKSGSVGNFKVKVKVGGKKPALIDLNVGSIIVATGSDTLQPGEGEYGYGTGGVVTLAQFRELLDSSPGRPLYNGREIGSVAYIYCVGSRRDPGVEGAGTYCSRYCCNAAVHASLLAGSKNPGLHQYHLYRDMRTYGKYELMFDQALEAGSTFLRFGEEDPPVIAGGQKGRIRVSVQDLLTYGEEVDLEVDLVVLVTGMVPRRNGDLVDVLKLPLGKDGFFNEIHPKLRPVETVVDGAFICGACQGPKNSSESVASALAAVTQSASLLKKGFVELEPLMAVVDKDACRWCGECVKACPYGAIVSQDCQGGQVAAVNEALCKGCGGCGPACPKNAIDLKGYTDSQVKSMIDALIANS